MNPEIAARVHEIRLDRIHGAGWLSRQAVAVLKLAVQKSEAATSEALLAELREVAQELVATRTAMTSIANAVARFLSEFWSRSQALKELNSLKEFASSMANELVTELAQAALTAAAKGAETIVDGDLVLTCSYSSTVCQAFRIAVEGGRHFEVLVAESRFRDRAYGKVAAEQLAQHAIPVEVIPDDAIRHSARRAKKALVGADSILSDGSLINGSPTYELATAAKENNIPFYIVCETAKFNVQSHVELEEGFEQIPSTLITMIITERGMIRPDEVLDLTADLRERVRFARL